MPVKERIARFCQTAATALEKTEPDSVIVTVRKDKVFFPERRVIHTFEALTVNHQLTAILSNLVPVGPVYYYALGPEPNLDLGYGLKLEPVTEIGREILYKIIKE